MGMGAAMHPTQHTPRRLTPGHQPQTVAIASVRRMSTVTCNVDDVAQLSLRGSLGLCLSAFVQHREITFTKDI